MLLVSTPLKPNTRCPLAPLPPSTRKIVRTRDKKHRTEHRRREYRRRPRLTGVSNCRGVTALRTAQRSKDRKDDVISGTKVESTRPFWIVSEAVSPFLGPKSETFMWKKDSLPCGLQMMNKTGQKVRQRHRPTTTNAQTQVQTRRATLTGNCCLQGHDGTPTHPDRHIYLFPNTLHPCSRACVAVAPAVCLPEPRPKHNSKSGVLV